jgi:Apea-like HEPN
MSVTRRSFVLGAADPSPPPKCALLIPFITAPAFPLKETEIFTLGGLSVELRPEKFGYSSLLIENIESEQAAHELFESLRIGFLAASLNINWGVRVRDKVAVLGYDSPMPNEVDVPLIYPQGKDLSRLIIGHGSVQKQVAKILPTIVASLEYGIVSTSAKQAMTDYRVRLSLSLYTDSYFEISDSARFLGLVTILEVLKDKTKASNTACALVDRWGQEAAEELESREAASIRGSLRYLKLISISRGISSVVKRHLGEDRATEAKELYQARSKLVHDGISPDDFPDTLTRTQRMVTELLAHILQAGSL